MLNETLLAALAHDITDDLNRLAIADWLEERGERDRAEFIRLQLALDPHPWRNGRSWLEVDGIREKLRRENVISGKRAEWKSAELPKHVDSKTCEVQFKRGFPDMFSARHDFVSPHYLREALSGKHPIYLLELNSHVSPWMCDDILRFVASLNVGVRSSNARWLRNFESGPELPLQQLWLGSSAGDMVRLLAGSPRLTNLQSIRLPLDMNFLPSEDGASLGALVERVPEIYLEDVESRSPEALPVQHLRSLELRVADLRRAANLISGDFANLERLNITLSPLAGSAEADSRTLPRSLLDVILKMPKLRELALEWIDFDAGAAELLRSSPLFENLCSLLLHIQPQHEARVLRTLFQGSSGPLALRRLSLWTKTTDEGAPGPLSKASIRWLSGAAHRLASLRSLSLDCLAKDAIGLAAELPELVSLKIVTPEESVKVITRFEAAPGLSTKLAHLGITSEGELRKGVQKAFCRAYAGCELKFCYF